MLFGLIGIVVNELIKLRDQPGNSPEFQKALQSTINSLIALRMFL